MKAISWRVHWCAYHCPGRIQTTSAQLESCCLLSLGECYFLQLQHWWMIACMWRTAAYQVAAYSPDIEPEIVLLSHLKHTKQEHSKKVLPHFWSILDPEKAYWTIARHQPITGHFTCHFGFWSAREDIFWVYYYFEIKLKKKCIVFLRWIKKLQNIQSTSWVKLIYVCWVYTIAKIKW